jgi:O-antigen ligase
MKTQNFEAIQLNIGQFTLIRTMTQLDQSALKARNRLLAMFLLLCVLDATLVMIARDRWAIGRILVTIVVMYFVIQGRKWAKWLLMSICSLLVVILITMVLALSSKLSTVLIVGSLIMAVLSAIIAIYMVTSKDLNRYFFYKRQAYSQ